MRSVNLNSKFRFRFRVSLNYTYYTRRRVGIDRSIGYIITDIGQSIRDSIRVAVLSSLLNDLPRQCMRADVHIHIISIPRFILAHGLGVLVSVPEPHYWSDAQRVSCF